MTSINVHVPFLLTDYYARFIIIIIIIIIIVIIIKAPSVLLLSTNSSDALQNTYSCSCRIFYIEYH